MSESTTVDRAAEAAHRRAMPVQRLIGNGMALADVQEIHRRSEDGERWVDIAAELAERNRTRATDAAERGHQLSASTWWRFASAAERFGQIPLPDGEDKSARYRRMIDDYAEASRWDDHAIERIRVERDGDVVTGWLHRPDRPSPPAVVIIGGFDGWREEYDLGARALVARGIAALLVDGPGQGESRLFEGSFFRPGSERAAALALDALLSHDSIGDRIGIWGNSFGGHLAVQAALAEPRFAACCVNGGTVRPIEILDRFPRFTAKLEALTGLEEADAVAVVSGLTLDADALAELTMPLLVLHGDPDQVFLLENAARIVDGAGSSDKTLARWADGDHCIYNHTDEKHSLVGDWFLDRLEGAP